MRKIQRLYNQNYIQIYAPKVAIMYFTITSHCNLTLYSNRSNQPAPFLLVESTISSHLQLSVSHHFATKHRDPWRAPWTRRREVVEPMPSAPACVMDGRNWKLEFEHVRKIREPMVTHPLSKWPKMEQCLSHQRRGFTKWTNWKHQGSSKCYAMGNWNVYMYIYILYIIYIIYIHVFVVNASHKLWE